MNKLKRTLALMAALAMTAVAFAGCGSDESSDSTAETAATTEAAAEEETTEAAAEEETTEAAAEDGDAATGSESTEASEAPALGTPDGTLGDDGDKLTILCWTDDDLKYMIGGEDADGNAITGTVSVADQCVYQQVGTDGSSANETYPQYFLGDEDCDIYFCDADWNKVYENNDEYSAPLTAVGITEDMFVNNYSYVVDMGKSTDGTLKGISWQATPGGYNYRTDLAEQYLGVTTTDEMQAKVADWDTFWATAAEVYTASGEVTAMADSLGGVWRAYSASKDTAYVTDGTLTVPDFVSTFIDMAKTNYDAGYISTAGQWTDDWLPQGQSEGSQANKTMGFFFPTWSLGAGSQLATAEGESTKGMFALVQGPSSWFWGGTYMCVSPKCDNATLAGQFIYDMTVNTETVQAYVDAHGDFVSNKAVMQATVESGTYTNELYKDGVSQFNTLYEAADGIDTSKATEYDATINTDIQNAVQDYCEGNVSSADDCMNEFLDNVAADLTDVTVG